MEVRKKVILDYINGKIDRDHTWGELELIYNVIPSSEPGDKIRKWIRWYEQKGKYTNEYAPGCFLEGLQYNNIQKEHDERMTSLLTNLEKLKEKIKEEPSSLLLRKKWQVQGKGGVTKWLESYENKINPEDIKKFRKELIESIPSPKRDFKIKSLTRYGTLAVISLPDFHIGREEYAEENSSKFLQTIENLLSKASHHLIEGIVFVMGNDYFNSDFDYKTTRGTPQFDYQNWKQTWIQGRDLVIQAIEVIKEKKCPITVVNIPGNHDSRVFYLGDYVEGYYRNDNQIIVDNEDKLVKAFTYGNVLLGFEHGEFRASEYESILANEYPLEWGNSTCREFLCGHLHAETVKEFRGMKLRHLPSLANESEWEKKQGYHHRKEAQMLVYSKDKLEAIYIE